MSDTILNPAEQIAEKARIAIYECIDQHRSFLLEAGAGAGKTESLVRALRYLIDKQGVNLIRKNQQVACITFTNAANDVIKSRTDGHLAIIPSTIHAFCWSLIKGFQPYLQKVLPELPKWQERLDEAGGIAGREINYELGYPSAKKDEQKISLHHNDVLTLTIKLMEQIKFRRLFVARYPILFIDEYQDTDKDFMSALKTHFLDGDNNGLLIGLFGDDWQKIYGEGCGKVESDNLVLIKQKANFRSAKRVVEMLNLMRPELPQDIADPDSNGSIVVYHTNEWSGVRLTGPHSKDDLPAKDAHQYLDALTIRLSEKESWDFSSGKTKILMLTHNILAKEQGYDGIADVFSGNSDRFIRKEDSHIKFLVEILEPVCTAYENKQFGEMFAALGARTPAINSHGDKMSWANDMSRLIELRSMGTIGDVLDHLKKTKRPRLPDAVEEKEQKIGHRVEDLELDEKLSVERLLKLRDVPYQQVIKLAHYIDDKTPFSTKHSVKGAEFENVLVIFGRGWNHYDFNQFLEWAGSTPPLEKQDTFERNRNLFYVTCSRPKKRLALLFTQKLSSKAVATLYKWFGESNIFSITNI
ncbi:MAG: AAA family ATPase [Nitrospira sp.]